MKEKRISVLLCITLIIFAAGLLSGCGKDDYQSSTFQSAGSVVQTAEENTNGELTEDDVIEMFLEQADDSSCMVTDCTLASDGAFNLAGVVQYTDGKGDPCQFAFVDREGYFQHVGFGKEENSVIADDSELVYAGNGTVTFSLYDVDSFAVYDYTVEFSKNDKNNVNFKASSELRKQ